MQKILKDKTKKHKYKGGVYQKTKKICILKQEHP